MSKLVCQIVIAAGRHPHWISDVRATDGFCEVRRGPAPIAFDTPIAEYLGNIGPTIFAPSSD